MKIAIYSTHKFEKNYLEKAFDAKHHVKYIDSSLSVDTVLLAEGHEAVSIFVNDIASAEVKKLSKKMTNRPDLRIGSEKSLIMGFF